ncbi:uncharacterized protein CC84DRAFT_714014 [Paraphaeosphaeria sporulosa]|uniref:Uncharacterized protein n=1 Tax=Paraphaeosphaeria sporulosa TaxID=1460663 RepID=A0A177CLD0_9PLEO|nr:uncharacterized protein CC84DRAFT_714014 [Paraphaeosphaeria sporulosa]OAG07752.1 hypothetical protein CC84DRAFT_714014 [Paraphaeosphaeria sporulosa]
MLDALIRAIMKQVDALHDYELGQGPCLTLLQLFEGRLRNSLLSKRNSRYLVKFVHQAGHYLRYSSITLGTWRRLACLEQSSQPRRHCHSLCRCITCWCGRNDNLCFGRRSRSPACQLPSVRSRMLRTIVTPNGGESLARKLARVSTKGVIELDYTASLLSKIAL